MKLPPNGFELAVQRYKGKRLSLTARPTRHSESWIRMSFYLVLCLISDPRLWMERNLRSTLACTVCLYVLLTTARAAYRDDNYINRLLKQGSPETSAEDQFSAESDKKENSNFGVFPWAERKIPFPRVNNRNGQEEKRMSSSFSRYQPEGYEEEPNTPRSLDLNALRTLLQVFSKSRDVPDGVQQGSRSMVKKWADDEIRLKRNQLLQLSEEGSGPKLQLLNAVLAAADKIVSSRDTAADYPAAGQVYKMLEHLVARPKVSASLQEDIESNLD